MKIKQLRITIEPCVINESLKDLRIEVIANGVQYTASKPFIDDHFESLFDHLIDGCREEIKRMIKVQNREAV